MKDIALYHGEKRGWIELITACMFAGKTDELIRRTTRSLIANRRLQIFKSAIDDRYAGRSYVSTHDGRRLEAIPVRHSREIAALAHPDTEVFAIDEVQFFDPGIVEVVTLLADRGARVILAGTDMTFQGLPFGPMPQLMAIAESVDKLYAICMRCGSPATRNQRLIDGKPAPFESPVVLVGGADSYEARCRHCHEVPRADDHQTDLLEILGSTSDTAPVLTRESLSATPSLDR